MSKKKPLNIQKATDMEIVRRLEDEFGDEISHIAPIGKNERGRVFSCLDLGYEATLIVDYEGWVVVRANRSNYGDVLGAI